MGPFPFIRFEQAEINGNFGDEYAYRKTQIQVLNALFVDNYFNGDKFFIAVNEIKNEIQLLNDAPTFASLELILPSPYPTSVGVEVYTLKIGIQQNNECFIEILFNLTDGVVTANDTTFTPGPDLVEVTTNRPFIAEELKMAEALIIYEQNGAAFFPNTFYYNPSTGIAERSLLRAYNWTFNQLTNLPQRNGVTDFRIIPKTVFRLRELSQIEKSMVSFFLERPIYLVILTGNNNWNVNNYLTLLPDGWVFDNVTFSSTKKQLSISNSESQICFVLSGVKYSGKWYFQRFVNPTYISGSPPDFSVLLTNDEPLNPNTGKLYDTFFYDYDQCEFVNNEIQDEERYIPIIKSGDSYRINQKVLYMPDFGSASLYIGIFDCNLKFLTQIGQPVYQNAYPNLTNFYLEINLPPLENGNYFIGIYQNFESEGQDYASLLTVSQTLTIDNFENFTQILEYGAGENSVIEGFVYRSGWLQRIRVPLNGAGQTYSLEESIYRNSDGTFQKPQNSTDENISLHTDYLDLQTQRAMTSATRHPIFVLANQNLSVQGDLEIATNQDYTTNQSFRKLQQMRFQAKNQGYQPNNNSCLG